MEFLKTTFFKWVAISFLLIVVLGSCQREDEELIKTIATMSEPRYKGEAISKETLEAIKTDILRFEENIDEAVKASGMLGMYYKMLAKKYIEIEELKQEIAQLKQTEKQGAASVLEAQSPVMINALIIEYIDEKMYKKALEYLHKAMEYYPENPILFNLAGISSARIAKAFVDADNLWQRTKYFDDAYNYYKRAIELDSYYIEALESMAVLLIFELSRAQEAEQYVLRILKKEKNNLEAKWLLARINYDTGRYEDAIAIYEEIISMNPGDEIVSQAQNNIDIIKDLIGGRD